jgi:hypothetical protein
MAKKTIKPVRRPRRTHQSAATGGRRHRLFTFPCSPLKTAEDWARLLRLQAILRGLPPEDGDFVESMFRVFVEQNVMRAVAPYLVGKRRHVTPLLEANKKNTDEAREVWAQEAFAHFQCGEKSSAVLLHLEAKYGRRAPSSATLGRFRIECFGRRRARRRKP